MTDNASSVIDIEIVAVTGDQCTFSARSDGTAARYGCHRAQLFHCSNI